MQPESAFHPDNFAESRHLSTMGGRDVVYSDKRLDNACSRRYLCLLLFIPYEEMRNAAAIARAILFPRQTPRKHSTQLKQGRVQFERQQRSPETPRDNDRATRNQLRNDTRTSASFFARI